MSLPKPQSKAQASILIANDLLSGRTVYQTAESAWSINSDDAQVFMQVAQAQPNLEKALADVTNVVGPYLVTTDLDGQPVHIREFIRAIGPTCRQSPAVEHH